MPAAEAGVVDAEELLKLNEAVAVQAGSADSGPHTQAITTRIREVDPPVTPVVGMKNDVKQSALPRRTDLGEPVDLINSAVAVTEKAPIPLGDEDVAVRQECERPRMVQAAGKLNHTERGFPGVLGGNEARWVHNGLREYAGRCREKGNPRKCSNYDKFGQFHAVEDSGALQDRQHLGGVTDRGDGPNGGFGGAGGLSRGKIWSND